MIHKGLTREGKHKERFHGIFVKYGILKNMRKHEQNEFERK